MYYKKITEEQHNALFNYVNDYYNNQKHSLEELHRFIYNIFGNIKQSCLWLCYEDEIQQLVKSYNYKEDSYYSKKLEAKIDNLESVLYKIEQGTADILYQ